LLTLKKEIDLDKRRALMFQDVVNEGFDFLINEYGFKQIESGLYFISYESKHTYVEIFHDKVSYEMNIRIGLLPEPKNVLFFDIHELVDFEGVESNIGSCYMATSKDAIERYIAEGVKLIKTYSENILNRKSKYFYKVRAKALKNERVHKAFPLE
jgi:hypothetical protein